MIMFRALTQRPLHWRNTGCAGDLMGDRFASAAFVLQGRSPGARATGYKDEWLVSAGLDLLAADPGTARAQAWEWAVGPAQATAPVVLASSSCIRS
jgi:hypothetical protein